MFPLRHLIAFSTFFAAAMPAWADPVTFATAQGDMTLEAVPTRIVALDVSAIDTMSALGVTPVGVLSPLYVDYLPDAVAQAEPVGSFFEPDMEAIAALAPDLIVIGGRSVPMMDALARIAAVADMSIGTDAFADGIARLTAYGQMLDKEAEATSLTAEIEADLAAVKSQVAAIGGKALILMTNGPKLSVFGPDSRFGWLHTELGFAPAVAEIADNRHGEAVSFEYIAEANPDTLLVVDRAAAIGDSAAGAQATLDTPLVQNAAAAQAGRIIYVSPAELYIASGGVQSLRRTIAEVATALGAM